MGIFLLLSFLLNETSVRAAVWLPSINSDLPIVGTALVFVGLETLSLTRHLPAAKPGKKESSLDLRGLVELDLALHGRRFILLEFGITAPAMLAGGLLLAFRSYWPLGAYIFLIGLNYVPLLIYALGLTSKHEEAANTKAGRTFLRERARSFGALQFIILVPLSIPLLALRQLTSDRKIVM